MGLPRRPASFSQTPAHRAHEAVEVFGVLTFRAPGKVQGVAKPVQLDAVEIPAIEKFLDHSQLEIADLGFFEIERRPPTQIGKPIGIETFEGGQFRVGQLPAPPKGIVAIVHAQGNKGLQASAVALPDHNRRGIVSGVSQRLRVPVLILGVHRDAGVPGSFLGELEVVGFSRPLQHPALVLGHVSAAEAEKHGIHGRVFNGSEHQRSELVAGQRALGVRQGGAPPAVDHGAVPVEQEATFPGRGNPGRESRGRPQQMGGSGDTHGQKAAPADGFHQAIISLIK